MVMKLTKIGGKMEKEKKEWINSNFNYQGLHKNEEIDEVKSLPYQSTFIGL